MKFLKKIVSVIAATAIASSVFASMPAAVNAEELADNVIVYADFNKNEGTWPATHYMNGIESAVTSDYYHSAPTAGYLTTNARHDVSFITADWGWCEYGGDKKLTVGKTYRLSFWALSTNGATQKPYLVKGDNSGYYNTEITISGSEMKKYEAIFTATDTGLPFLRFWKQSTAVNVYLDDIMIEELREPELIEDNLPADGALVTLGYSRYSMTFDQNIQKAEILYDGTAVSDITIEGKNVYFGVSYTHGGTKTISVTVTDEDGLSKTFTSSVVVPNTMIVYADFNKNEGTWPATHYMNGIESAVTSDYYHSAPTAGYLTTNAQHDVSFITADWGWCEYGGDKKLTVGKTYRLSFWALSANGATQNPYLVTGDNTAYYNTAITISGSEMKKYEAIFTATDTGLPCLRFWKQNTAVNVYLDDIMIEEVVAPKITGTTLPAAVENLGYDTYKLVFDKNITSADVTLNGKTVPGERIKCEGNVVTVGLSLVVGGENTINITATDADGIGAVLSKKVNVPNRLVAYADFENPGTSSNSVDNYAYYMSNLSGYDTAHAVSPGRAAKVDTGVDIHFQTNTSWTGAIFNGNTLNVIPGKNYKISWYAQAENSGMKIGIAQNDTSLVKPFDIATDKMTRYEMEITAVDTTIPRLYRENAEGVLYLDDVLVEEVFDDSSAYSYAGIWATNGTKATSAINTFNIGQQLWITGSITNINGANPVEGQLYAAFYKENKLIAVSLAEKTIAAAKEEGTSTVSFTVTVPDGAETAKVFMWDKGMNALTTCATARAVN